MSNDVILRFEDVKFEYLHKSRFWMRLVFRCVPAKNNPNGAEWGRKKHFVWLD
jgi:hypothetical protein